MIGATTFRQLDGGTDLAKSSLDDWYDGIRDVKLRELQDGDLARCCRQNLFNEYVVPVAIDRLQLRPLAGDVYDGELLAAMKSIEMAYWTANQAESKLLREIAVRAKVDTDDDEIRDDVEELVEKLT